MYRAEKNSLTEYKVRGRFAFSANNKIDRTISNLKTNIAISIIFFPQMLLKYNMYTQKLAFKNELYCSIVGTLSHWGDLMVSVIIYGRSKLVQSFVN